MGFNLLLFAYVVMVLTWWLSFRATKRAQEQRNRAYDTLVRVSERVYRSEPGDPLAHNVALELRRHAETEIATAKGRDAKAIYAALKRLSGKR